MKVVLLCGGQGTRLREETEFKPKPMVDVGGKPIVWHIMKLFAHHGLTEFVLCLGYKGNYIKEYFLNYETMNNDFTISLGKREEVSIHGQHAEHEFKVTLADTGADSMTGGRIKRIAKYVDSDHFMVTYGDGVSNVDVSQVLAFHKAHGKLATLTTMKPQSRFGILDLDDAGKVQKFREKPTVEGWVNAGYFVLNRKVLDYIEGDETIFERGPLERLAAEGQLMAYRHEGFFFAMDTYREYQMLNEMWTNNKAPWKVWA
jgi:glucose-1-phosphate cytidylyltransferase